MERLKCMNYVCDFSTNTYNNTVYNIKIVKPLIEILENKKNEHLKIIPFGIFMLSFSINSFSNLFSLHINRSTITTFLILFFILYIRCIFCCFLFMIHTFVMTIITHTTEFNWVDKNSFVNLENSSFVAINESFRTRSLLFPTYQIST